MDNKEIDKILQGFVYDINLHLVDGEEAIKDHPIIVETKAEIKALIKQEKLELLKRVEEAIPNCDSGCEHKDTHQGHGHIWWEGYNLSRSELRHRISDMRGEIT